MLCLYTLILDLYQWQSIWDYFTNQRTSSRGPFVTSLFLLCAKGFSALLSKSKEEGRLKEVAVCRNAPCISHLLFADDSLLFC